MTPLPLIFIWYNLLMLNENDLTKGFSEVESIKVEKHLSKLIPHLTPNKFVIVGGLAIRYHLQKAGIPYPDRPFNDLDIIVENIDVVHPDITKDFLTYHFHQGLIWHPILNSEIIFIWNVLIVGKHHLLS